MRIALVAPLAEAVPPKLYGGTERVVSWLAEELVRQGHQVTLFASAESQTSADLVVSAPQSLRLAGIRDHIGSTLAMLREVRRREDEFDVIHFHIDLLPNALFHDLVHKCLITLHGRLDLPDAHPLYKAFPEMPLVSISDSQRLPMPKCANWLATIQHGLASHICPFDSEGGDYLAFLGRISPEKRPDRAIEIAKKSGTKLKIAAKVDAADLEYFKNLIEPMLDHPLIEFIGEINEDQKCEFLGRARALLFPIDWPEPFGLVMTESMSAGTPIIAWRNGSVPEVITPGVSGVIVDSVDEAVAAVETATRMSRAGVRADFERRFTAEKMARSYIAAYRSLLAMAPAKQRSAPSAVPHPAKAPLAAQAFHRELGRVNGPSMLETPLG
ncbi:glycosyltransferase family 4 protein [Methylocella tundrae]|uniref:Glycosyltransferase involved in cell wall bisynthesis n=1 Tax=Methylocella tundrae TaxID=227605 RepID=A0A4U8Z2A3_METTU|nr:glycosyltransferase family 4 protein [Methylocella tundrae]WPP03442.1 glycosyltransferase family 4 protein [Methylocella tundrae]VFU09516.1 Glycosyltransferase involved in cell wall bisynthesis [Methylocella tundrae]